MGPLGWQEMIVIFVLALLLFGPKKLPELGKNLAKAMGEFRRASNELKDSWNREMNAIEQETQEIKRETESLGQVTTSYSDSSTYDYDSPYEYGYSGYPDSSDSSNPAEPSAVGASATQGADNAALDNSQTDSDTLTASAEPGSYDESQAGTDDGRRTSESAQAL